MESVGRDLRYAVRTLRRTPAFTAAAVLTLALGIGANAAMFSVVYGILLRPLPYAEAGRLALIQREQDQSGTHRPVPALFFSPAEIETWQHAFRSFDSTAFYSPEVAALATESGNEVIESAVVSDAFFSTLRGRIVAGRFLQPADDHGPWIVVSERLSRRLFDGAAQAIGKRLIMNTDTARRLFGPGDPVGRTMSLPVSRNGRNASEEMTLVGIVSNVKYSGLDAEADDAVYRPFEQQTWVAPFLVVRTAGDPRGLVATIGRAIAEADRGVVVSDLRPLDAIVSDAAAQPRFRALLLGSMAGLALAMAVLGLYGVIAYSVAQRTKEIGIHMALGAQRRAVLSMVLREGLALAGAGVAAGLALSVAATRALRGLLYGIAPTDPFAYAFAAVTLFAVALLATYVPARRAADVDPLIALRHE